MVNLTAVPTPALLAGLGAIALIGSSFLPWIKVSGPFVGTLTRSGTDGIATLLHDGSISDGWLTVLAGIMALGVAKALWQERPNREASTLAAVLGGLVGLMCVFEFQQISQRFSDARAEADSAGSIFGVHVGGHRQQRHRARSGQSWFPGRAVWQDGDKYTEDSKSPQRRPREESMDSAR